MPLFISFLFIIVIFLYFACLRCFTCFIFSQFSNCNWLFDRIWTELLWMKWVCLVWFRPVGADISVSSCLIGDQHRVRDCLASEVQLTVQATFGPKSREASVWILIRRSNRNFNIDSPGQTKGIWLFSEAGEWGIWQIRPSRGRGIDFCLGGVEKIEPEVSGFQWSFFFRAPKYL